MGEGGEEFPKVVAPRGHRNTTKGGGGSRRTSSWMVVSTSVRGKISGASHSSQLNGAIGVLNEVLAVLVDHGQEGVPVVKLVFVDLMP